MPLCNGADIGCVSYIDNITGDAKFRWSTFNADQRACRKLSYYRFFLTSNSGIKTDVQFAREFGRML